MAVDRGQASEQISRRLEAYAADGAPALDVNGHTAYRVERAHTIEAPGADDPMGPVIGWTLRDGLAVEIELSPTYARQIDYRNELRKIAEKIKPVD